MKLYSIFSTSILFFFIKEDCFDNTSQNSSFSKFYKVVLKCQKVFMKMEEMTKLKSSMPN